MYGRGSENFLLDDLDCIGSESSLLDCRYDFRDMNSHSCTYPEDAGVRCGGK